MTGVDTVEPPSVGRAGARGWRTDALILAVATVVIHHPMVGTGEVYVPTGITVFPHEIIRLSERWAAKRFVDIRHFNEVDKGGHFAAFEQPATFVDEVRAFFRLVR